MGQESKIIIIIKIKNECQNEYGERQEICDRRRRKNADGIFFLGKELDNEENDPDEDKP